MFTATSAAPQTIAPYYPTNRHVVHSAFYQNSIEPVKSCSIDAMMAYAPTPMPPVNPLTKVSTRELEAAGIDKREFDLESLFGTTRSKQRRKRVKLDHLSMDEKNLRRKVMNRVAAQAARDKKKAQQTDVERLVSKLAAENRVLRAENAELRQRRMQLESENTNLRARLYGAESSGAIGSAEGVLGVGVPGVVSGACAVSPAAGPRTTLYSRAPRLLGPPLPLPVALPVVAPSQQFAPNSEATLVFESANHLSETVAYAEALRTQSGKDTTSFAHQFRVATPSTREHDAPHANAPRLVSNFGDPCVMATTTKELGPLASGNGAPIALPLSSSSSSSSSSPPFSSQFLGIVLGPVPPSACTPSVCAQPFSLPDIVPDIKCDFPFDTHPTYLEKGEPVKGDSAQLEDPALFLQLLNEILTGEGGGSSNAHSAEAVPADLQPAGHTHASAAQQTPAANGRQLLEQQPLAFSTDAPFSLTELAGLDMFPLHDLPVPLELS